MTYLNLTFGCGPSDKVSAIFDGRVRIEGCELQCFPIGAEESLSPRVCQSGFRHHGTLGKLVDPGPDVWSYGVPDNRKELEAMFRYSVEQGLAPRKIELEEFFAPGALHRWQGKD